MPTEISGSTGVNKIQDGTVVNADINSSAAIAGSKLVMPTGSVLQVVRQAASIVETSSTSYVDLYSATITPSSTSSKIFIMVTNHIYVTSYTSNNWRGAQVQVLRGTSNIHDGGNYGEASHLASSTDSYMTYSSFHLLDSPSTTSATTYYVKGKSKVSDSISFNNSGYAGTGGITLMEIAG